MTAGVYTTTVVILGGAGTTSEWGDPVEGEEVSLAGVPASIVSRRRTVVPEGGREAITVRYYVGRLPHGTPVTGDNRLRDEQTGTVYLIDHVHTPPNPALPQDVQLDLRTVS